MNKYVLIITAFFAFTLSLRAQNSHFVMDSDEGCGSLTVHFTNESTGSGVLSYFWTFGNGSESHDENPFISYTTPGTYTITLELTDDNGINVFSDQVIVHPFPNVAFSGTNLSGCVPVMSHFTDESVPGDANIISWDWNFGDGTTSTENNPNHEYSHSGSYSIILNVEDALGCENNIIYDYFVNVSNPPNVSFTAQPSINCEPIDVSFMNSSTGDALPLSYSWSFGDGGSSSASNPTHFFQQGNYSVNLTVTDANNCSSTGIGEVSIADLDPHMQVNPSLICTGELVSFSNTEGSASMWDFGDGTVNGYGIVVYHTFEYPGMYTVTLTAGSGNCVSQVTQTINVHASPDINFNFIPDVICEPTSVSVENTSTESVSYQWDIYYQNMEDTSIVFSSNEENPTLNILEEGIYYYTLEATSNYGCISSATNSINAVFTNINAINVIPEESCIPFDAVLTPDITSLDNIVSYDWYKDSVWFSSEEIPPSQNYNEVGVFHNVLVIETEHGCIDSLEVDVLAGTEPDVSFYVLEDSVCRGDQVHYVINSPDDSLITSYTWDSFTDNPIIDLGDSFIVSDTIGTISIGLIGEINGCNGSFVLDPAFVVKGPFLDNFQDNYDCGNPYLRNFSIDAYSSDSIYWSFGDYSPVVQAGNQVQHLYSNQQSYMVNITAHSNTTGCSDYNYNTWINVEEPNFTVQIPELSCPNLVLYLDTTYEVDSVYIDWGDGSFEDWFIDTLVVQSHLYTSGGLKNINVIASGWGGCLDTISQQVTIAFASPLFTTNPVNLCLGDSIFIDGMASSIFPLEEYKWYFDDTDSLTCSSDSTFQYLFDEGGEHTINYKLTDSLGCEFISPDRNLEIHAIDADVSLVDSSLCLNTSLFVNVDTDLSNLVIDCDYGDMTAVTSSLQHLYLDTGLYQVNIQIEDPYGCSQAFIFDSVSVQEANLRITLLEDTLRCYPESPHFVNLDSVETPYVQFEWSDNLNNSAYIPNPEFVYQDRGHYQISVIETTSNGCVDSTGFNLVIDGPYAEINISDDIVCKNDTVQFWMSNDTNIVSYEWTLGDGYGISNTSNFEHSFNFVPQNGKFEIVLSYPAEGCDADGDGQDDKYTQVKYINIFPVVASFDLLNTSTGLADTNSCSPLQVQFNNTSQGNGNVYRWTIDSSDYSQQVQPDNYSFINTEMLVDTFDVALYLNSQEGCKDTACQKVIVRSVPEIQISEDQNICLGNSIDLWATGGDSIIWSSEFEIENRNNYQITIDPTQSSMVYARIIERNGCEATDSVYVFVQQVPQIFSNFSDTMVVVGQEFNINIYTDQDGVEYLWTPVDGLSCSDCPSPIVEVTKPIEYTVEITDSLNCHTVTKQIFINVFYDYTIDVPNTFTPNDDGENDIVYVRGWGIKDLIEFRIYNRWGEEVFFSNDLNMGWDGKLRGKPQNIDTYVYYAKVLTFNNTEISKKGTITLLR